MSGRLSSLITLAAVLALVILPACASQDTATDRTEKPSADAPELAAEAVTETLAETAASFFELKTRTLEGEPADLGAYRGRVVLAVNVASKCGLTPQYEGIEALHRELAGDGLAILGFPSNDFQGQEPGTPAEIREFCTTKFDVTFPLFEKMKVTGDDKSGVYRFLTTGHPEPNWNFTKYLIDRQGRVRARFDPRTAPDDAALRAQIKELLTENS